MASEVTGAAAAQKCVDEQRVEACVLPSLKSQPRCLVVKSVPSPFSLPLFPHLQNGVRSSSPILEESEQTQENGISAQAPSQMELVCEPDLHLNPVPSRLIIGHLVTVREWARELVPVAMGQSRWSGRKVLPREPEWTIPAAPGCQEWLRPGATPEPFPAASKGPASRWGRRWACGVLCRGAWLRGPSSNRGVLFTGGSVGGRWVPQA